VPVTTEPVAEEDVLPQAARPTAMAAERAAARTRLHVLFFIVFLSFPNLFLFSVPSLWGAE